jgi:DNA-binding NarL/FixJ family response regulator
MKIEVSPDGSEYILRIPREVFVARGGLPQLSKPLTQRQREILALLWDCKCNKEISAILNITVRTVKFHISALLAAYNVANRVQLINTVHTLRRLAD